MPEKPERIDMENGGLCRRKTAANGTVPIIQMIGTINDA